MSIQMSFLEDALTKAIEQWMEVASSGERYALRDGNAQGIARSLALLKGTSFEVEWEAGLDRYQKRVVGQKVNVDIEKLIFDIRTVRHEVARTPGVSVFDMRILSLMERLAIKLRHHQHPQVTELPSAEIE
jgi:hypothetical protein